MKITQDDNDNIHIVLETEDEKRAMWLQLNVSGRYLAEGQIAANLSAEAWRLANVEFDLFDRYDDLYDLEAELEA